jgi:hypothetical protein
MSRPRPDLVGQKFGKLTVIASLPKDPTQPRKAAPWQCLCDCGVTVEIANEHIQKKRKTCGQCPKIPSAGHPFRNYRRLKTAKKRNCNVCFKPLPPTRYFNHEKCHTTELFVFDIEGQYQDWSG